MSDTDQKKEKDKFNETLKRMLETPPKPHVKNPLTESDEKKEQGGVPAKKPRPARKK